MSVADGTNTLGTFIVVFNKATPVWDSEVRFTLTPGPQNKELKLSVLDETDGKPELIGDALIPLKEALESNPVDGYDDWHQLTYKGKYAGEVYLEMTFYPTTPPIKKKRTKNVNKESVRSDAMQQSQAFGNSQFTMSSSTPLNMTAATTRPLPEQPGAAAAAAASTAAPAPEPVPVSNVLPHHMQQTNISSHLQYRQNTLPLAPHYQNNTYVNYNNNSPMDMSAMSRTLPNPFDYQEFGELSAIPPEQHQTGYYGNNPDINNGGYHHSNGSNVSGFGYIPEEEEDPMAIFSTPLPPGPNDTPAASASAYKAEDDNNHYQHFAHTNSMNSGAVDEECHRSRSTHRYAPARSSPLSQSTSSDLSDLETPPPAMSGSSAGQLYYQEFSHHHNQQQFQDPYYSQHQADDYYYHSQDHHQQQQQQHYGSDLPPVPPAHNSYVTPAATAPPKRSAIRRKPITRRTPGGGNSTGGEVPFSAESYNSSPAIPSISVSPSAADDEAEEEEEESNNRRHSAPVQNHHHSRRRDDGGLETMNPSLPASSGAKPLPQAPACEPYVGDGQWDLSDELNAGYSDDVYGGFMQQMPVLRERAASAVDLPSLSKSHHHHQLRRSRHGDYADEYHGMEMEDGIRYVH
ncbi:hypothetical protein D0Z00_002895 [Geotrichum galactomycetum]|uniref:Uncharacterized protein n=1 Tax=Geotrichum galactomycetum TaxID=27317 RepID=A0ACB6V353_9ASCO|nr:hypothetical protein D0Z00_002895 [Geotrichum candidum]